MTSITLEVEAVSASGYGCVTLEADSGRCAAEMQVERRLGPDFGANWLSGQVADHVPYSPPTRKVLFQSRVGVGLFGREMRDVGLFGVPADYNGPATRLRRPEVCGIED